MTINANKLSTNQPLYKRQSLAVRIATTEQDIEQCLRLRYQVFGIEMGAKLDTPKPGLDIDYFDQYAMHLMVLHEVTGEVIATTRLMNSTQAAAAGAFYSETEFDMETILELKAKFLEIGRTCIAESYRNGAALSLLWRGIVRLAVIEEIDFLIGCASIPLNNSTAYAHSIMRYLKKHAYTPEVLRVYPRQDLPENINNETTDVILPTLLKGYLKLGAKVCGEACYDKDFHVADVLILLHRKQLEKRFKRHMIA